MSILQRRCPFDCVAHKTITHLAYCAFSQHWEHNSPLTQAALSSHFLFEVIDKGKYKPAVKGQHSQ